MNIQFLSKTFLILPIHSAGIIFNLADKGISLQKIKS